MRFLPIAVAVLALVAVSPARAASPEEVSSFCAQETVEVVQLMHAAKGVGMPQAELEKVYQEFAAEQDLSPMWIVDTVALIRAVYSGNEAAEETLRGSYYGHCVTFINKQLKEAPANNTTARGR